LVERDVHDLVRPGLADHHGHQVEVLRPDVSRLHRSEDGWKVALMARSRRRKGGFLRRLLLIAVVAFVFYVATHVKAYVDDQRTLQHFVDTHTTTTPATPGR
jgi:hypothetical protein